MKDTTLVKHNSPAGPYWYHPDHPSCQDGQVLWEEPEPPAPVESEKQVPRTNQVYSKALADFGHSAPLSRMTVLAEQLETELRATQRKLDEANKLLERAKNSLTKLHESSEGAYYVSQETSWEADETLTAINTHLKL